MHAEATYRASSEMCAHMRWISDNLRLDRVGTQIVPNSESLEALRRHLLPRSEVMRFVDEVNTICSHLGYVLIKGLKFDPENKALIGITALIGEPIVYYDQPFVTDVKPERTDKAKEVHSGVSAFPLHSDKTFAPEPPEYVIFQCVSPDMRGGGHSVLSDARKAFDRLDGAYQVLLKNEPITIETPTHINTDICTIQGHILEQRAGKMMFRFRLDLLSAEISPRLRDAVEQFHTCLLEVSEEIRLEQDDLLVVNNHLVLHGRTALEAKYQSSRYLKRIYATPRPICEPSTPR